MTELIISITMSVAFMCIGFTLFILAITWAIKETLEIIDTIQKLQRQKERRKQ